MSDEQGFPEDSGSSSQPEPWKLLGRDSPAGKALFNLYGGHKGGRNKGIEYTQQNKQKIEKKLASGWTPPPLEPEKVKVVKPQVQVPRLIGKMSSVDLEMRSRGRYIPRRKPGDVILEEIRAENERLRSSPMPRPVGPVLDDAEKDRLAMMMQFRGKPPKITDADRERYGRAVKGSRQKTQREELQDMFDAVLAEIEERKEFMDSLEAAGGLKREHSHIVQGEIAQRIEDLKKLNQMISQLDGAT